MIWWTGVPSHKVDDYWAKALPLLRRGFENPELADPYYEKVQTGHAQLWCVNNDAELVAALLTETVTIGGRKICNIISVGGTRMQEWLHFIAVIEDWARANNCVAMRHANCRLGWAKALKDYHITKIVLEKGL